MSIDRKLMMGNTDMLLCGATGYSTEVHTVYASF